jgi:hypothetical protein
MLWQEEGICFYGIQRTVWFFKDSLKMPPERVRGDGLSSCTAAGPAKAALVRRHELVFIMRTPRLPTFGFVFH